MKLKVLLVVLFGSIMLTANGQTELYGSWNAHCAAQQINNKSMSFCDICSYVVTDTSVTFEGFTVEFDSTHVRFGDSEDKIPYMKKPSGNYITFVKDKRPYGFDVMITTAGNLIVLKAKSGNVIVLERKKEKSDK